MRSILRQLKSQPIFKALSDAQLHALMDSSQEVVLDRDAVLFNMGDVSEHFYFLKTGRIKVYRSSPQGMEKVLSIVQPGQVFAEAAMFLKDSQFPASAYALQASEVIGFRNSVFVEYLHESAALSMAMLSNLSTKLHTQIAELDSLTMQNATLRLLNYINLLIDGDCSAAVEVEFPAPKQTIASRLSITPETLSRSLSELNSKNIVKPMGNGVVIPDLEVFRKYLTSY